MLEHRLGVLWWLKYLHYQVGLHFLTALADWSNDLERYRDSNILDSKKNNTTSTNESKAMDIKLLIREKRMEKGMSQMELADRLGVTQGAVMKWETGRCLPALDRAVEIAEAFGCTVDELIVKERG